MRRLHLVLYALLGVFAVGFGAYMVVAPPDASFAESHFARELGAAGIFIGLMSIWCARHYEQRAPVHYSLMVFAALFAVIHWVDHARGHVPLISGLYNTVPLVLLLVMMPRRAAA